MVLASGGVLAVALGDIPSLFSPMFSFSSFPVFFFFAAFFSFLVFFWPSTLSFLVSQTSPLCLFSASVFIGREGR